MPIIRPGEATKPTAWPKETVYPIFPATGDIRQVLAWDEEAFRLHTNQYKYYLLDLERSKPDKLYGEPTDLETGGEVYKNQDEPIYINAYLHWGDAVKELTKFGITTERDTVAEFSINLLKKVEHRVVGINGLVPKRGDVIVVYGDEYVIEETREGNPWYGNVQFPIHIYAPLTRKKHSAISDDRADTTVEQIKPPRPTEPGPARPEKPIVIFNND